MNMSTIEPETTLLTLSSREDRLLDIRQHGGPAELAGCLS